MNNDYFSKQSNAYKSFRPHYPQALFDYLLDGLDCNSRILDCATGNGQAATNLATSKTTVIATDISQAQMSEAPKSNSVHWIQAGAESLPLQANSIQLITVAQALHWFDFDRFYAEAYRVLVPGGEIAAWTYSLLAICDQFGQDIEQVIRWFYTEILGDYWPPERRWVDEEYRTIPFPFEQQATPSFTIELSWDRKALLGYISSWSAVQLYKEATGQNPLSLLEPRLLENWPDASARRNISWPLSLRVGKSSLE